MESTLSNPLLQIPLENPLLEVLAKKSLSLSSQVLYGSSRLGTMDYLSGQYGMSYHRLSHSERVYDTVGLQGHRPYYSYAGNQLATGGLGAYGQPFWMNQAHSGQHLIGQKQYELSNHLGNVQVTVSDLPYRKQLGGTNLYQAALKSVYDYYPFGSLMPGRTVMDTTAHCVDMTRIHRVWQPAYYLPTLPLNQLFSEVKHWGEASYRFSTDQSQLALFIEDEQSGIELLLKEDIGSGHLLLEGKVMKVSDQGIVFRVQGVDGEGKGVVYHQEHLSQFNGKLEIPLDSAYSHYVVNIQGLLHWSVLDNTKMNINWVETEVLVRVCDEVGDPYRFGFNGQEKVNEISGLGNHNTAEFWEYDTRLGRRWNLDPVDQISVSNYAVFANNPIVLTDVDGDCPTCETEYPDAEIGDIVQLEGGKMDWIKQEDGSWTGWGGELNEMTIVADREELKSADHYDYSIAEIAEKWEDDLNYIFKGEKGTIVGRWWNTFVRDWKAGSKEEKIDFALTIATAPIGGRKGMAAPKAAKGVGNLAMRSDIVIKGGRSGQLLKNATGPANSVVKGGAEGRVLITNQKGQVIWDITKERAKSVTPGQGFGPKVAPTQEQLNLIKQIWGN